MFADDYDEPPVPLSRAGLYVLSLGVVTGALSGAIEAALLLTQLPIPMSFAERGVLAAALLGLNGLVGGACFAPYAVFAQLADRLPTRAWRVYRRYQVAYALGVATLLGFFMLPLARELFRQERPQAGIGMASLVILVGAVAWFNGGYFFRRWVVGAAPALGYRAGGTGVALLFAGFGVLVGGHTEPSTVVPERPNVVLISIDTLRRDHVGRYGSLIPTPTIDQLGEQGLTFDQAYTPIPETLPAHAAMLAGVHPHRLGVVSNGNPVRSGFVLLPEHLAAMGYRNGAFVSSFAVDSGTGLDQGFHVYDDDFFPVLRGFSETRIAKVLLPLLMRVADPADFPFLLERGSPETIRRALTWTDDDPRPVFLFVHLFDPHSPYEPREGFPVSPEAAAIDHRAILKQEPGYVYRPEEVAGLQELYRQEVAYTDTMVKALLDGLRAQGRLENALVIFTADHGESLGQHNFYFNHHGVYNTVLAVPMIVWSSRLAGPEGAELGAGRRFERLVSVDDVANTIAGFAGSAMPNTESTNLLDFGRGSENTPEGFVISGREGASLAEGQLCGVLNRSIKYIRRQDGSEMVFDLVNDPGELQNVADSYPGPVAAGRAGVVTCAETMVVSEADAEQAAMLEALGYLDGDDKQSDK